MVWETDIVRRAVAAAWLLAVAGCAGGHRPPQFIGGADLVYPVAAMAAGVEGHVVIRYDITADGHVANAVVELAEPPGVFDAAALAAVQSWRFRPAAQGRRLVVAPNRVSEVTFRLGDDGSYGQLPKPTAER